MLRSKPRSRARPAGTTSISAEIKSSSVMPYFSSSKAKAKAFTPSLDFLLSSLPFLWAPSVLAISEACTDFCSTASASLLLDPSVLSFFSTKGRLPMRISRLSPSTISLPFFAICWLPRWGRRSVTQNTGSSGSSPITISTTVPSVLATTPYKARGKVTHW